MRHFIVCLLFGASACGAEKNDDSPAQVGDTRSSADEGGSPIGGAGGRVRAGRAAGGDEAEGAGGLDGFGGADLDREDRQPRPQLLRSSPALGAIGVYPAPLWSGQGEEGVIELTFSEPMVLRGELLLDSAEESRPFSEMVWSEGATHLALFIRSDFSHPQPFFDATEYWLDTAPLSNESGVQLDPHKGLEDGEFSFTTGHYDALLNHSCGHTLFGPFATVVAQEEANVAAADIAVTHTQYTVVLPPNENEYKGWIRARFPTGGPYRLYFDQEMRLGLSEKVGAEIEALQLTKTPRSCPGITREITLHPTAGEDIFLQLATEDSSLRNIIVELVPQ